MGGGFGSKQIAWKHTAIAALLSKQAGRPVQLMLDREAENLAAGNRNPTRQHVRLGAKRDGTLVFIECDAIMAVGAYMVGGEASDVDGAVPDALPLPERQDAPDGRLHQHRPGRGVPRAGLRRRGVRARIGDGRAGPGAGDGPAGAAPEELLRDRPDGGQAVQLAGRAAPLLRGRRRDVRLEGGAEARSPAGRPPRGGPKRRGIGFAGHDWIGGAGHPPGYAWVKLNNDGTADVVAGTHDIGTGSRTGLLQIAAEELGLPFEKLALHLGDTAYGPYAPVSSGSATQATIGPAIQAAALDAKRQLFEVAAPMLEVAPHDLELRDGDRPGRRARPDRTMAVSEVLGKIDPHMIQGHGSRGPNPSDKTIHTFGAQAVEVEVDVETGEVTVLRVVAAHDCGRIVNPLMVDSQVVGAVTQGIGFALTEERLVDMGRGVVVNANLENYLVPTMLDVPEIVNARVDLPDPVANPTGAKGIGEPPLIPTAPAIANAVYDAIGVRIRQTPLSRQRVLTALAEPRSQHGTSHPPPRTGGESASAPGRPTMRTFEYTRASTVDEAPGLVDGAHTPQNGTRFLAGGTDLLTLMKADVVQPSLLVDIKRTEGLPRGIEETRGRPDARGARHARRDRAPPGHRPSGTGRSPRP